MKGIELARHFQHLAQTENLSIPQIAQKMGCSAMIVYDYFDVLNLDEQIIELIESGRIAISTVVNVITLIRNSPGNKSKIFSESNRFILDLAIVHERIFMKHVEAKMLLRTNEPIRKTLRTIVAEFIQAIEICEKDGFVYLKLSVEDWQRFKKQIRERKFALKA
jgi:hypothetical protein